MTSRDEQPSATILSFLGALWSEFPANAKLVAWCREKQGARSESTWCATLPEVVAAALRFRPDYHIYFGVAAQSLDKALEIARQKKPMVDVSSVRGSSASAVAIPGLWVDLDIRSDAHSSAELPPDRPAALALLQAVPLPPSIIVDTGHGIHSYWLFKEPWFFESDADRSKAETLVRRLQQTIRIEAQKHGWGVDSTADLARVLRLPGTLNHKGSPKPVEVLHLEPDRRYDPDEFEGKLVELQVAPPAPAYDRPQNRDEGEPAELEPIVLGCAWLRHCLEDRAQLPESEWYGMLSIVGRCFSGDRGGRELAHEWSEGHPSYSRDETDRKLEQALKASGPRTCNNIASELGGFARFCSSCGYRGKIKSPIVLGRRRRATQAGPYRATDGGLILMKDSRDGPVPVALTNFAAWIAGEIIHDDGTETERFLEIEADLDGREHRFTVSASKFPSMAWTIGELGPSAVIHAGFSTKDHVRAAIQMLSGRVPARTVFGHLGWRMVAGELCYLHAGGAIGRDGAVGGVEVSLPSELERFHLPPPVGGDLLIQAVQASLEILDLVPDEISLPAYFCLWRSVVGGNDFAAHVSGQTGQGKSEFVALLQQHFGPQLDARHLPASWSSTGNALEALAFVAKDALMTVDDFAPEGSAVDVQRQHKEAARLLRAQGNQSGRQRLRADASLRPTKPPRGFLLSTGEDVPKAQSIRARMLVLEVPIGAMNWELLTVCQRHAAEGVYAQALAGFLQWLAPQYADLAQRRRERTQALRHELLAAGGAHRRTPAILAELGFGLELFVAFARDIGALSEGEANHFEERAWAALKLAGASQGEHLATEDPVRRFLELLSSALAAGDAHLVSTSGEQPLEPEACGWRRRTYSSGMVQTSWEPQGMQVGWVDGDDLFLDPHSAFKAAQRMAAGDGISLTPQTLWKRMKERGFLASTDVGRERNISRRMLQGVRRKVLHLKSEALLSRKPAQPAQPAHGRFESATCGPVSWAGFEPDSEKPAHKTGPEKREESRVCGSCGPLGPVGPVSGTREAKDHDEDLGLPVEVEDRSAFEV